MSTSVFFFYQTVTRRTSRWTFLCRSLTRYSHKNV